MPLTSMSQLLADARRGGYAVCYCEAWNLESLQAIVEVAEELQLPIITGFNGGFLEDPGRPKPENLVYYAGMGLAVQKSEVPVALLLNETDNFCQMERGIDLGFNALMVDNARLGLDEYQRLVEKVVSLGHASGVSVEAQIGLLPSGDGSNRDGQITDPRQARRFVEETGIDALSVSIGNVHILTKGKACVDLDVLRRIHVQVKVPLVLHGGSGFPPEYAKAAIGLGVAKFNFGTVLKQVYLAALQEKIVQYREPMNPHPFLGKGGRQDVPAGGREAVKRKVKELITLYSTPAEVQKQVRLQN